MSKDHAARVENAHGQGSKELEELRAEIAKLHTMFVDMARLMMPPAFRDTFCDCGRLGCSTITAVKPGESEAKRFNLCDQCKMPEGWMAVGTVELAPAQRETVAIANRLGVFNRAEK